MRTILVLLVGLVLVGCSSKNIAKNKTIINNMSDFLKVNEAVCSKYRSTDKVLYGCGTATSKSFELSKSKSLLQAKVIVSDSLSNSESQTIKEDSKGISQSYNSNEVSQIFETNLNQYKIVYDKTFVQNGKYRSYIVIEYKLET